MLELSIFDGNYSLTPYMPPADSDLSGSSLSGQKLSAGQIQNLMRQAGWPEDKVLTGSAIFLRESGGGWTAAKNVSIVEHSVGLAQINMLSHHGFTEDQLTDPLFNLQVALQIYRDAGNSFRPWGGWTDGHYRDWLPQATAAYNAGGGSSNDAANVPADSGIFAGVTGSQLALLGGLGLLAFLLID